jgi:hypothetical protein
MVKKWAVLGIAIIVLAAVAGCGSGTSPTTVGTTPSTTAITTSTTAPATETTVKATVTTKAPAAAKTYSDGTYQVGTDIPAGLYKSTKVSDNAYWQIASDANGQKIIANDNVTGQCYVQVTKGQYLTLSGITIAEASAVKSTKLATKNITDGTYLVGTDIAAGRYKGTPAAGGNAYWQVSTDPNGDIGHIVANGNPTGSFYVQVTKGLYLKIGGATISQ